MRNLIKDFLKGQNEPQESVEIMERPNILSIEYYKKLFLSKRKRESRCCVAYINEDTHKKVAAITRLIANDNVSIGGYINNVLDAHFEQHKEEIRYLYDKSFENFKI